MSLVDPGQVSMLELFRMEAEGQAAVLTAGLLALERDPVAADQLEACMRAAHSLKGAARIVGLAAGVRVAHALEDCFVAAQRRVVTLRQEHIDRLLEGVDLLAQIAKADEADADRWTLQSNTQLQACLSALDAIVGQAATEAPALSSAGRADGESDAGLPTSRVMARRDVTPSVGPVQSDAVQPTAPDAADRSLRVTAESLNQLLGLASESLVKTRWVRPFLGSLLRIKRAQHEVGTVLDSVQSALPPNGFDHAQDGVMLARRRLLDCQRQLAERIAELDAFDRRSTALLERLHDKALACHMRPIADGLRGIPRLVRDVAHAVGKRVRLEVVGARTQVDRDILVSLEAPLGHLIRNAIDHGIESPDDRMKAGKHIEGVVRIEARHSAGTLQVVVRDDGRGVDLDRLRTAVIARGLINEEAARSLSDDELLQFLFLPGFSLKDVVSDISGRGVGLDAVQDMAKQVRGAVHASSVAGKGTEFRLQLPVTLSTIRALVADVAGELYAFPLAYIEQVVQIPAESVLSLEGRPHFSIDGRHVGLVTARQVFGAAEGATLGAVVAVVIVGDGTRSYGVIVDELRAEKELAVQPLDPRLGKIKDISAGALLDDGSPVLIVDGEDLLRSVGKLASEGIVAGAQRGAAAVRQRRKRVLVVDDSLTVRELERKLLANRGYEVEIAVDGMEGWNAARTSRFDLVVTDVDMPRLDGIELVQLMSRDPNLRSIPVVIVSYKDREEDRRRGLEAGAAYYLAKGSFHDDTLVRAVVDLIGEGTS